MATFSYGYMVLGSVKLNPSLVISAGVNDTLIFKVDNVEYTIYLDAGTYVTSKERFDSQLITHLNTELVSASCPVRARLGGLVAVEGTLVERHYDILIFEHESKDTGHVINSFSGNAKDAILGAVYEVREASTFTY
jgi:hypothetical protein